MAKKISRYEDEGNIWEEEDDLPYRSKRNRYEDEDRPRAPLMLRVLAWVGVVLLCFVGGYLGTSWAIKMIGNRSFVKQDDVVSNQNELQQLVESDKPQEPLDTKKLTVKLFYPKNGAIVTEPFDIITNLREEDIAEITKKLFSASGMFPKEVSIKHVFRNASVLFLDVTGPFIPMLAEAGKNNSALFITGLVRTMKENFPPVTEVRFLVNGAVNTAGSPVDLTAAWSLPN